MRIVASALLSRWVIGLNSALVTLCKICRLASSTASWTWLIWPPAAWANCLASRAPLIALTASVLAWLPMFFASWARDSAAPALASTSEVFWLINSSLAVALVSTSVTFALISWRTVSAYSSASALDCSIASSIATCRFSNSASNAWLAFFTALEIAISWADVLTPKIASAALDTPLDTPEPPTPGLSSKVIEMYSSVKALYS